MAAALSMPKQPFRITSPLIHDDPDEFNSIVGDTMLAQVSVLLTLFVYSHKIHVYNILQP
jgi:hypothetical protein